MAFTIDPNFTDARAFSLGPLKQQTISGTVATTDTTATLTAPALAEVRACTIAGVILASAPVISGNTVTITFLAPGVGAGYVMADLRGV